MKHSPLVLALLLLASPPLVAQEPPRAGPGPRVATVTAGVGNAMGWFGAQAERYFHDEQLSVFGGLGYTPEIDTGDPTGLTFAAGLRGFTPGRNHRGFLELSVSQVALGRKERFSGDIIFREGSRQYGPGIQAGYQYTADGGFTAMVSAGFGYAIGLDTDRDDDPVEPMLNAGLGYTWR